MPEFNPEDWKLKDRDAKIKALVDAGMPADEASVAIDAVLNAAGEESDTQANPGGHWRRQQAGGDAVGTDRDPSPDSYKAAQEQGEA